jgi:endonuclease/exonuclease/phosphatase (EEP) superfamily protein YafD
MNQSPAHGASGVRRSRRFRRSLALLAAAATALVLAPVTSTSTSGLSAASAARRECVAQRPMKIVEANIKSGMSAAATQADINAVYSHAPDFVAFNEVPYRADELLAPGAYDIWRSPGRYIGANAVTWAADRWTPIARGTIYVSNKPGRVEGQTSEWGLRYANWATLRSLDGCHTVSVVSFHVAPRNRITQNLLVPSIKRLAALSRVLSASGPVLFAGDMNAQYNGSRYPRKHLNAGNLTATFDMTGQKLVTHDGGGSIDYVLVNRREQFSVTNQFVQEVNSDHDLLVADLLFNPTVSTPRVPPTVMRGHVLNVPESSIKRARAEVVRQLMMAIRHTPRGETVRFITRRLKDKRIRNELARAYRRGVVVQFVTTNRARTKHEQSLVDLLGSSKKRTSHVRIGSARKADRLGLRPTVLISSLSAGKRHVRIDVDRFSEPAQMARMISRAEIYTQRGEYESIRKKFAKLRK